MKIRRIQIENFKSFRSIDVELKDFQIFLGANAAGKSNFVEALNFLRELENQGLENAISLQGGIEYLTNLAESGNRNLSISVDLASIEGRRRIFRSKKGIFFECHVDSAIYKIIVSSKQDDLAPFIPRESIELNVSFRNFANPNQLSFENDTGRNKDSAVTIKLFVDPSDKKHALNKLSVEYIDKQKALELTDILPTALTEAPIPEDQSILQGPVISYLLGGKLFGGIVPFDFDPKTSKRAARISSRADLETDGSNSSLVLKTIFADKEQYRRFSNLVRDLLPFVQEMEIAPAIDKSVFFKIKETFAKDKHLPSPLISDGTINVITLIIALFFQDKDVLIFEEPERNLHPALISKLVQLMRERSKTKQVLVTTHNTELLRNAEIDEVLFVSRDINGSSVVTTPAEKEQVRKFLKNEIGLDELYVSNLLG